MVSFSVRLRARPTWRHLLLVMTVLGVCLTASYAVSTRVVDAYTFDSAWLGQTSDAGGFSIRMPGLAMQDRALASTLGGSEAHFYQVSKPGINYGVGYTDYPNAYLVPGTKDQHLDTWRDNAIAGLEGTLLAEQQVSVDGNPGRQLTIQLPDGKGVIHGRVYLVDYRPYLVMAITANAKPSREATRFLDSFELVE